MKRLLLITLIPLVLFANDEDHIDHIDKTNLKLNFSSLDFSHSKKKEDGKRVSVELDHQSQKHHYQLQYERTDTNTKPNIPKDLEVNKYTLKYHYQLNPAQNISFSYTSIDDNLMKETDGGNIYGLGYNICRANITQYFSDYKRFDVYQTDLSYKIKKEFDTVHIMGKIIGKYIHLKDKNSNNFSKNAKTDYFTLGLKLHSHINGYHLGAGTYLGKRIFAVMKEGFLVQHHAMEFKETYMAGIGHAIGKSMVHLRYAYSKADEVPSNNPDVKVDNLSLEVAYKF
jgi:hypothetical protein